MKTTLTRTLTTVTVALLALCAMTAGSTAKAGQPEILHIDETNMDEDVSDYCGFPVQMHLEANLAVKEYKDGIVTSGSWKQTWTNLATGSAVVANNSIRLYQVEMTGEGEIVLEVFTSGPGVLKPLRGGAAWVESGRFGFRLIFDSATGEVVSNETLFQVGHLEEAEFIDALCALLSE